MNESAENQEETTTEAREPATRYKFTEHDKKLWFEVDTGLAQAESILREIRKTAEDHLDVPGFRSLSGAMDAMLKRSSTQRGYREKKLKEEREKLDAEEAALEERIAEIRDSRG